MLDLYKELLEIAGRLDRLVARSRKSEIKKPLKELTRAVSKIGEAWSGSWLGYHAYVYYQDLQPRPPGAHFSAEWGLKPAYGHGSSGDWCEFNAEEVKSAVRTNAGNPDLTPPRRLRDEAVRELDTQKENVISILETSEAISPDQYLKRLKRDVDGLSVKTQQNIQKILHPSGSIITRDTLALSQGSRTPPHLSILSELLEIQCVFDAVETLAKLARQAGSHLQRHRYQQPTLETNGTNVFIGHGRSQVWRELKDFIEDRLNLPVDEFNRVPVAGITTISRLSEMLDSSAIAFLVMTGEDVQPNGDLRARMNVVHEAGLFQGRLGFDRAIVLLEEGCEEFSNIVGLGQIRFPKGDIRSKFEDIREVLERERLAKTRE